MKMILSSSFLLVILGSVFTTCSIYLIPHKVPWVDEMYTWYGIHHNNFGQFWDSIGSGINYSPPLYFFLNWIWQLFLPLSLNGLRIESLLWILGGTGIVYLTLRQQIGSPAALIGVSGVLFQSSLLFEQSMEARSYGLFFFCGAGVLYTGQSLTIDKANRKTWIWTFIAHLSLCLTHYLGIVFSAMAAMSRYLSTGPNSNRTVRIPPEIASWAIIIPVYGYLINNQSAHLGAWPRPNEIEDLITSYLVSINPLFFSIPIILALILYRTSKKEKNPIWSRSNDNNNFIALSSILWITIPSLIWLLSQITPLNLFKDRYFIPKEAGWMVLTAIVIDRIPSLRSKSRKNLFLVAICIILGVGMLSLSTHRKLFASHPSRNYYHWLIVDESIRDSSLHKVYAGDHLYFPNVFISKQPEIALLKVTNVDLIETYRRFNQEIKTCIDINTLRTNEHLLITEKIDTANPYLLQPELQKITDSRFVNSHPIVEVQHIKRFLN